jgi:hypothetical protein
MKKTVCSFKKREAPDKARGLPTFYTILRPGGQPAQSADGQVLAENGHFGNTFTVALPKTELLVVSVTVRV